MKYKIIFLAIIILGIVGGASYYFKLKKANKLVCSDCNVIIISITSTRTHNLSFYNSEKNNNPNLESFFDDAFIFKRAISPASLTFPDYISLHYSLQPMKHRLMNYDQTEQAKRILSGHNSLPAILQKNGYTTAAFVSDDDYNEKYLLGSQFDLYFDKKHYPDYNIAFESGNYSTGFSELMNPTLDWLRSNYKKKFFLLVQSYDMHCPYKPSEEFRNKIKIPHSDKIDFNLCYITIDKAKKKIINNETYYGLITWKSFLSRKQMEYVWFSENDMAYLKSLYDAELATTDQKVKVLLDEIRKLGLSKNTIVIFMAEHGDNLGENGFFMKANIKALGNLQNINIAFPFLIKHPNWKGRFFQDQLFMSIDFAPTILELLGINPDEKMQGKSFLNSLGNDSDLNDYAYSGTIRNRAYLESGRFLFEAVQDKTWKYALFEHQNLTGEVKVEKYLFNLKNDPWETNNLIINEPVIGEKLDSVRLELREKYTK